MFVLFVTRRRIFRKEVVGEEGESVRKKETKKKRFFTNRIKLID